MVSNDFGENALHLACQSGDLPTIQIFLSKGLDIEQKRTDGMTPLLKAAQHDHADAVEFLISQGTQLTLVYCDD